MKKRGVILVICLSLLLVMPMILAQDTGQTGRTFFTGGWSCVADDTDAYWTNSSDGSNRIWIAGARGNRSGCFFPRGSGLDIGNLSACCPGEDICTVTQDAPDGKCLIDSQAQYCRELTSFGEDTCENTDEKVGERSVEDQQNNDSYCEWHHKNSYPKGDQDCYDKNVCNCKWENDECVAEQFVRTTCYDPNDPTKKQTTSDSGFCWYVVETINDRCDTNYNDIIVTTVGKPKETLTCQGTTRTYQCPSSKQLPFFPAYGIIVSLALISVIYTYFLRKKTYI